ncbi:hypothetical protein PC129_g216 [Phytophthora cactorum]|uniref:Uncharacterized protein n=1 Tax=Phytophthora cactorum TaxID=29920 RepID=A0A329SHJ3_9STRA|nr:hypothetical protein Pcac1_g8588 [Phytophthora cactorum]KAG2849320.1 hypothetical protein PC111_g20 [Phytophthora cactorum]KAG2869462.1 hypothetical protein PC113_g233 [Phytophthora cactorum]KAG2936708.1 hypothetical protein PC114_g22 [Phytophthora cactorum]KAG2944450.1 hypothetical protein PC115_g336 [Phytophthora cactorum]
MGRAGARSLSGSDCDNVLCLGGTTCDGTPYFVGAVENSTCAADTCFRYSENTTAEMISIECTTDYMATLRQKFAGSSSSYVLGVQYKDEDCNELLVIDTDTTARLNANGSSISTIATAWPTQC